MPGQLTSPNFVYRPSVSLRRTASSTPQSPRGSRLVMLVSWPGREILFFGENIGVTLVL